MAFLRGAPIVEYGQRRRKYRGRRVELNAFTSDQFVAWLETKLEEQAKKVIPDPGTLEQAYKRAAGLKRFRAILGRARAEVESYIANMDVPDDLRDRLQEELTREPTQSWDDAIEWLVPAVGLDE